MKKIKRFQITLSFFFAFSMISNAQQSSLKEIFLDDFMIGVALNKSQIRQSKIKEKDLIKKEFDGKRLIKMNGPKVLQFSMSNVANDILELISSDEEYILFPHQAGKLVLDVLERKLPKNVKILKNYPNYGNLVSASIPNLIRENFNQLNGNKIIISGFGVGLSHNAILLELNNANIK